MFTRSDGVALDRREPGELLGDRAWCPGSFNGKIVKVQIPIPNTYTCTVDQRERVLGERPARLHHRQPDRHHDVVGEHAGHTGPARAVTSGRQLGTIGSVEARFRAAENLSMLSVDAVHARRSPDLARISPATFVGLISSAERPTDAAGHTRRASPVAPELSVVLPVHDEQDNLPELHRRLHAVLAPIEHYEIIFVDDGSRDSSAGIVASLAAQDRRVKLLRLSRNFGHQAAMAAGLDHARGRAVVLMDGDLQDPPEVLAAMVSAWRDGAEVVYAVRQARKEHLLKRIVLPRLLSGGAGPVRSARHPARQRRLLPARPAGGRCHRGAVGAEDLPARPAQLGRLPPGAARPTSATPATPVRRSYTFRKLRKLATDGIIACSSRPLRLASYVGFATLLLTVAYFAAVIGWFFARGTAPAGWTSLVGSSSCSAARNSSCSACSASTWPASSTSPAVDPTTSSPPPSDSMQAPQQSRSAHERRTVRRAEPCRGHVPRHLHPLRRRPLVRPRRPHPLLDAVAPGGGAAISSTNSASTRRRRCAPSTWVAASAWCAANSKGRPAGPSTWGSSTSTALRQSTPGRGRTLHYDILQREAEFEAAYDLIVLFDVLEHIEDDHRVRRRPAVASATGRPSAHQRACAAPGSQPL